MLLTTTSCDPLNRRAVRVSMGSVFLLPWTWLEAPISSLGKLGFKTVSMALCNQSIPLDSPCLKAEPRLAIVMGTEGDGLAHEAVSYTHLDVYKRQAKDLAVGIFWLFVARFSLEHGRQLFLALFFFLFAGSFLDIYVVNEFVEVIRNHSFCSCFCNIFRSV